MVVKYRPLIIVIVVFIVGLVPAQGVFAKRFGYPVVIVPGMMASLDKKLMYQDIEDNKWGFVPLGNVYKALINELELYSYEKGDSLFIAFYDWRKPVSETWKKYLKPKIDEAKRISGQSKVDIVAHSMGGLLARAYIQSDEYENDVNKLVMMGTPNYGASGSYSVWEGGIFPNEWPTYIKTYAASIEWRLQKKRKLESLTRPSTYREFFPSIKDLLPTKSFVKDGAGMIELSEMKERNDFLIELNNNIGKLNERVFNGVRTYAGITGKTMEEITVNPVVEQEVALYQRWRDGHPVPDPPVASSDQGDETVLLTSATVPDVENYTYDGTSHVGLPDIARFNVPDFLNPPILWYLPQPFRALAQNLLTVPTVRADGDEYVEPDSMLSFTVSPNVDFEVIDPDGKILSRDKNELGEDNANFDDDPADSEDIILVTIRNPKVGKYTLKITGNTGGDYYVDSTYVNDNGVFGDSNEGKIGAGEEKTIEATVSETAGAELPASETKDNSGDSTTTNNDNKIETKTSNSSGANTSKNKSGTVLGVATVRVKLSQVIFGVKNRLTTEIVAAALRPRKDGLLLLGPVNEMLSRARAYEVALASKKTKVAAKLLQEIKGDYRDFTNKVEKLIASGKLNKQTVNVLTALVQRLGNAGLR